jgi:hypothetical protein
VATVGAKNEFLTRYTFPRFRVNPSGRSNFDVREWRVRAAWGAFDARHYEILLIRNSVIAPAVNDEIIHMVIVRRYRVL